MSASACTRSTPVYYLLQWMRRPMFSSSKNMEGSRPLLGGVGLIILVSRPTFRSQSVTSVYEM